MFEVIHNKRTGLKRRVKPQRNKIRISLASFKVREGLLYSRVRHGVAPKSPQKRKMFHEKQVLLSPRFTPSLWRNRQEGTQKGEDS